MKTVLLAAGISLFATGVHSQQQAVDTKQSTLSIHVGKAGIFSGLGHEHDIRGPIHIGRVVTGAHPSVEVHVDARALKVIDKDEPEKDRAAVQKTMLGPQVLDSERFNDIIYKSASAEPTGEGQWVVHGDLTLRGRSRPVNVQVRLKDGHYIGEAVVKQTDFGIKPPGKMGVRAADEVRIEFDVLLAR
ncbi:MAG TPA: YceI family protein [Candidatus Polarisedimenticolia bacterium]|jgi:polyisoprenoid-binding protein YceI|nr:YceI family protein [Candidatus Polarisedimenticolia bacterium]